MRFFKDISHFAHIRTNRPYKDSIEQNPITPLETKCSFLFVTLDTRPDLEFVKIHNKNIQDYCNSQQSKQPMNTYSYKFTSVCEETDHKHIVYWCKMFLVNKWLLSDQYDYVAWLDSDTLIRNFSIDVCSLVQGYDSDLFIGFDRVPKHTELNAGLFIFRNSARSKLILEEILDEYKSEAFQKECINSNTSELNGLWSGSCYEQGAMNNVLEKYRDNVTVFPKRIFYQYKDEPGKLVFIQHLYGRRPSDRSKLFKKVTWPGANVN